MSQIFKDLIFIKLIDNTIASLWILPLISPCNKDVGLNHSWAVITSNVGTSISTCPLSNGVCLGVSRIITLHLKWSSKTDRYLELCFITGWHFCFTCEKEIKMFMCWGEMDFSECPSYLKSPDLRVYHKRDLCLIASLGQCDRRNFITEFSESSASWLEVIIKIT